MAGHAGPSIVRNGLVFHLDAADKTSYVGSGSTWKNLGHPSDNVSLYSTWTFDSSIAKGTLKLPVFGSSYGVNNTNLYSLFPSTSETFGVWFYTTEEGNIIQELGTQTPNTSWHYCILEADLDGYYAVSVWNGSSLVSTASSTTYQHQWAYVVGVYDGNELKIYVNGVFNDTTGGGVTRVRNSGGSTLYYSLAAADSTAAMSNGYANGNFGEVQIYNRALSTEEIKKNFDAKRQRFGV